MAYDYILKLACADRAGLVACISGALFETGANITEAQQYNDPDTQKFFMRIEFSADKSSTEIYQAKLDPIIKQFNMDCLLRRADKRKKTVIMTSKYDHCLVDLLHRYHIGELDMEITAIISNHPREGLHGSLIGDLPFYHLPISPETKPQQEAQVQHIIQKTNADLVVLARYMQILSNDMADFLSGRCINIHHSFLPGFKGAKPYHQAHKRGVKMIGATSHYVTADLDEGPIIAQDVAPISHSDTPAQLIAKGRDIERRVLARAVKAHIEDRTFISGQRTIVFS